jgi:hypothetical protein
VTFAGFSGHFDGFSTPTTADFVVGGRKNTNKINKRAPTTTAAARDPHGALSAKIQKTVTLSYSPYI